MSMKTERGRGVKPVFSERTGCLELFIYVEVA